jgi:hypothetical protein
MLRAGVDPDIAERCLAHKIDGVRGVYDRYAYYKRRSGPSNPWPRWSSGLFIRFRIIFYHWLKCNGRYARR